MVTDSRPIVCFDDETKSGYDLPNVGRIRYTTHKEADLICMGHKLLDQKAKLWLPGAKVPFPFLHPQDFRFAAHNIQFDAHITATLGKRYGFKPIPLSNQIDIMAVAARFGLPQSLEKLGAALKVSMPKLTIGRKLKNIFCSPPYHDPKKSKEENKALLRQFYAYCIRDVDCMVEIMGLMPLPYLPESEQHIWQVNCEMNTRGLPIDHAAVRRIDEVCTYYREQKAKLVPKLTDGAVNTIGQRDRIIEWCGEHDVELKNLQAQTVADTIDRLEKLKAEKILPFNWGDVLDLLKLRQLIGGAAVKKFKKLDSMSYKGRIYDNSKYHGAGTGRTTGGGFQYLNLPRATTAYDRAVETLAEAVEKAIRSFYDTTVLQNPRPLDVAKALVRPMIRASDGKLIFAVDWGSIEYILLMWFAGEHEKVEAFRGGEDPYIRFATKLFGVEYDQVTGLQRQQAKPPVLGSGYMLGWGQPDPKTGEYTGLISYAAGMGIEMTEQESKFATNTYRGDHPRVKDSWYELKKAAHKAVEFKGSTHGTHNTTFVVRKRGRFNWLIMTIPSGRSLFYCDPVLKEGKYGATIRLRGVHPQKKNWTFTYLNPQRIIENVIQALGRDVLQHGVDNVIKHDYTLIGTIYDEIICEEDDTDPQDTLNGMIELMCDTPPWAKGLPLKADGYYAKRYRKG